MWCPLLLGVIAHEVAHGWAAEKCGDPTARLMGRITLNPIAHIDLMGTIILPVFLLVVQAPFLFGWAKPVPVNFGNLRRQTDMALVAAAGPLHQLLAWLSSAPDCTIFSCHWPGPAGFYQGSAVLWVVEPVLHMARISVIFQPGPHDNQSPSCAAPGRGAHPGGSAASLGGGAIEPPVERYGMLVVIILIATGLWERIVQPVLDVFLRLLLGP